MAATYVLISSYTVTAAGGDASVTFSSIPSTYTDLIMKVSARDSDTGGAILRLNFNGSSTSLSGRNIVGSGSAVTSATQTTFGISVYSDSGDRTANTFGNGEFYIPNYAGSNNKSTSADGVEENNATAAYSSLSAGLWSNTAAITSITAYPSVANFKQYSTFYLYGIKNS